MGVFERIVVAPGRLTSYDPGMSTRVPRFKRLMISQVHVIYETHIEPSVSLYTAGPVLADRIGVAVLIGCDS
jgi:hypothetical protein